MLYIYTCTRDKGVRSVGSSPGVCTRMVMMMQAAQALCVLSVLMALGSALGWEAGWM